MHCIGWVLQMVMNQVIIWQILVRKRRGLTEIFMCAFCFLFFSPFLLFFVLSFPFMKL